MYAKDEVAILALERIFEEDTLTGIAGRIEKCLADEFRMINHKGMTRNKKQYIESLAAIRYLVHRYCDIQVFVRTEMAFASGTAVMEGYIGNELSKMNVKYVRIYIKENESWKAMLLQTTTMTDQ